MSDLSSLDLTRGKDREYLRRAISDGWPIKREDMERYYAALQWALQKSVNEGNARQADSCVRTFIAIVGQRQSDEQLDEKYRRIDTGSATERIDHSGAIDHAHRAVQADDEAMAVARRLQIGDNGATPNGRS